MKPTSAVKVEIGFIGNRLALDLPFQDYLTLAEKIKTKKSEWITVELSKGSNVEIKATDVQFIKIRKPQVRELSKRDGYNLKDICSVMPDVNYDVFRQKIKRENIELDYGTYKRILLTTKSVKNLGLTQEQVRKIETRFNK